MGDRNEAANAEVVQSLAVAVFSAFVAALQPKTPTTGGCNDGRRDDCDASPGLLGTPR